MDKRKKYDTALLLGCSLLFYLFFAFYDGVVICVDSPSYIGMYLSREPFYCTFLAALRAFCTVFGGGDYLMFAVCIQSVLAAFAAWSLAVYLQKVFSLTFLQTGVVMGIPLAASLLCRFAARRSSMYSNSILTEGITVSLFLLFTRYLLEFYYERSRRSLVTAAGISLIMIASRKQMYVTLILLCIVICTAGIRAKKAGRSVLAGIVCALGILVCNFLLDTGYNYAVHGEAATHSSDNRFLATVCFYTAERADGERIEDAEARRLFYQIYDICDEQGYLKHHAKGGWYGRVSHFGDYYDCIQIDTMWPAIQAYVRANYEGDDVALEQKVDEITSRIITGLLPGVWPKVFGCFADNFLSGLVTTVAKRSPILIVYSVLVFVLYFVLLFLQIRAEGMSAAAFFAVYVLVSIVINVSVVSAVIFCQTRYTIYNMPLFYIALWLLAVRDCRLLRSRASVKS